MKAKMFQIKSKRDAKVLSKRIRERENGFSYYFPLLGTTGGYVTMRWCESRGVYTISSTGAGWQMEEEIPSENMVDYLLNERKFVNEGLRYLESA
ncbi:MAG: hypothetical protein JXC33_04975 [Deltaproteobacteria bacterium]|nr:hypothetical protein [Deltaproteobacteria bacterium]